MNRPPSEEQATHQRARLALFGKSPWPPASIS
jgi:hypothetical protein